jgi:hypothetical protein
MDVEYWNGSACNFNLIVSSIGCSGYDLTDCNSFGSDLYYKVDAITGGTRSFNYHTNTLDGIVTVGCVALNGNNTNRVCMASCGRDAQGGEKNKKEESILGVSF